MLIYIFVVVTLAIRVKHIVNLCIYTCAGETGSIVLCISPLTSLMMDQRNKFAPRGLKVEFVGEQQTDSASWHDVIQGKVQLVYLTPENLIENKTYRKMLLSSIYQEKLVAICVDEAHCIQTWGDQFRVTFSQIGDIRSLIPRKVKIMALTATASEDTLRVAIKRLSLKDPVIVAVTLQRKHTIIMMLELMSIWMNLLQIFLKN